MGLSERSRHLWAEIVPEVEGAARRELLAVALQALHRADEAARIVAHDGLLLKSERSGLVRRHPAAVIEAEARRQFVGILRDLGLAHRASVLGD